MHAAVGAVGLEDLVGDWVGHGALRYVTFGGGLAKTERFAW
jgi:hypothetical protein